MSESKLSYDWVEEFFEACEADTDERLIKLAHKFWAERKMRKARKPLKGETVANEIRLKITGTEVRPPPQTEPYIFRDRDSGEYKILHPDGQVVVLTQTEIRDGVLQMGQVFNIICRCGVSSRGVISPFECPNCGTIHIYSGD